jgi:hypothetical protein
MQVIYEDNLDHDLFVRFDNIYISRNDIMSYVMWLCDRFELFITGIAGAEDAAIIMAYVYFCFLIFVTVFILDTYTI